jgi:hypothetical protein
LETQPDDPRYLFPDSNLHRTVTGAARCNLKVPGVDLIIADLEDSITKMHC